MSRAEKRAMIDPSHKHLSVVQQCGLLGLGRSSFYYQPVQDNAVDLVLMAAIDRQFLETPYYGSRRMVAVLRRAGYVVNRKRVRRLMRQMGLHVIWQKPNTSKPNPEHKVYPYLLRDLVIDRPNQVWATDITYIPMSKGFLYLVAIMDWHSRAVLSWRLCCATIKTPRPATIWHTSDGGAAFGGQAGVKPEAARGGGPKGQALHQLDSRTS